MRTKTLIQHIASMVQARINCAKSGNSDWHAKHTERLNTLAREFLPSGSGFDNGSSIYLDSCTPSKIVLATSFHHMNEGGYYDGWTDHTINIVPSFDGFEIASISGRDRNDIKDHIAEVFGHALSQDIVEDIAGYKAVA